MSANRAEICEILIFSPPNRKRTSAPDWAATNTRVLLYVSMETVPRGKAAAPEATHELVELSHIVPAPQLSGPALATIPKLTKTKEVIRRVDIFVLSQVTSCRCYELSEKNKTNVVTFKERDLP
jgi:hypothetical protein